MISCKVAHAAQSFGRLPAQASDAATAALAQSINVLSMYGDQRTSAMRFSVAAAEQVDTGFMNASLIGLPGHILP